MVVMVASGAASAVVVMAWTGIYFSTHPSTYQSGKVNVTNASKDYVTVGVGQYDVELENFDLDESDVNIQRREKVKEVNTTYNRIN